MPYTRSGSLRDLEEQDTTCPTDEDAPRRSFLWTALGYIWVATVFLSAIPLLLFWAVVAATFFIVKEISLMLLEVVRLIVGFITFLWVAWNEDYRLD